MLIILDVSRSSACRIKYQQNYKINVLSYFIQDNNYIMTLTEQVSSISHATIDEPNKGLTEGSTQAIYNFI